MTREQARQILDAVAKCRETSWQAASAIYAASESHRASAAGVSAADSDAFAAVVRLVYDLVDPAEWGRTS